MSRNPLISFPPPPTFAPPTLLAHHRHTLALCIILRVSIFSPIPPCTSDKDNSKTSQHLIRLSFPLEGKNKLKYQWLKCQMRRKHMIKRQAPVKAPLQSQIFKNLSPNQTHLRFSVAYKKACNRTMLYWGV